MRTAVHLGRSVAHRVSPVLRPSIVRSSDRTKCTAVVQTTYQMSAPATMEAEAPKAELVAEVEALKKQMAALEVGSNRCDQACN